MDTAAAAFDFIFPRRKDGDGGDAEPVSKEEAVDLPAKDVQVDTVEPSPPLHPTPGTA
jgi:hypothetical protein